MIKQAIPWVTSLVTLWGMWVIGNRKSYGWIIGLANQVLWVSLAIAFQAWGLLPLTAALIVIYTRNLIAWKRIDDAASPR